MGVKLGLWHQGNNVDLKIFENRVLRGISGPKRNEKIRDWRILHNDKLHNLYSSPNIIRSIKSRRIRLAGHAALENRKIHTGFWCESQKERNHQEYLAVGGKIILKWNFER
jgi:hypothetical protein